MKQLKNVVTGIMLVYALLIPVKVGAAAAQDEEEKKEQGIIPPGDPALAQKMQAREWGEEPLRTKKVMTRAQEVREVLSGYLIDPLIGLVSEYDYYNPLLDPSVEIGVTKLWGHSEGVVAVAISPDGTRVVTGSLDGTAQIWGDVPTGRLNEVGNLIGLFIHQLNGHTDAIRAVAISPDGTRVVTGSQDKTARIWDLETGKLIKELQGHTGAINAVAISSDGKRVVTGSQDKTARIWNLETGELIKKLEHDGGVYAVAISSDGTRVATGSIYSIYDSAVIWDLETGKRNELKSRHAGRVVAVAISPDGTRVVTGSADKTARIWNLETGELIKKLEHDGGVYAVAISPDSAWVVTGSEDKTDRIWDLKTGELIRGLNGKHEGGIRAVAISPDGRWVVTGSEDSDALIWFAQEPKPEPVPIDKQLIQAVERRIRLIQTSASAETASDKERSLETIEKLIEQGANPEAIVVNKDGTPQTALQLAEDHLGKGHPITRYLRTVARQKRRCRNCVIL